MKLCKKCINDIKRATGLTSWDGFYDASNKPKHYFVAKRRIFKSSMWFEVVSESECEFWAHVTMNAMKLERGPFPP